MVSLYKDPKGETVLGTSGDGRPHLTSLNQDHIQTVSVANDHEILELKKQISALKTKLAEVKAINRSTYTWICLSLLSEYQVNTKKGDDNAGGREFQKTKSSVFGQE